MKLPLLRSCVVVAALLFARIESQAQSPMSGTYRLFLCATPCTEADSARALAVATIVIANDSMASSDEWKRAMAEIRAVRVMRQSGLTDNVCFNIQQRSARVDSEELYFGIQRNGSTHWERRGSDSLAIRVFQSPDASYVLRWVGTGSTTTGEGWSAGWRVTQPLHRNAFFVALRKSPPASNACR